MEGIAWIVMCKRIQEWFGSTSVFSGLGKARSQAAAVAAIWFQYHARKA